MIDIKREGWDAAKKEAETGNEWDTLNPYCWESVMYAKWSAFEEGVCVYLDGEPRP